MFYNSLSRRSAVKIKLLDTVVLQRNLPNDGLQIGDIGAVVETYEPDGVEVEFITGAGKTRALVTLKVEDVRPTSNNDILSVRSLEAA